MQNAKDISTSQTRGYLIVLAILLIAGVFLRLWQYVGRESFWKDETGLARNFLKHDLAHIHEPFHEAQAVPMGFAQVSKVAEIILGHNEHAFWLWPLILSCTMLPLAAFLYKKWLPNGTNAWLLAVGLFAFNSTLINHTTQFKPYLSDAFWTLILMGGFWAATSFEQNTKERKLRGYLIYFIAGLLALWMSYTSVFVIAGLGTWMILEALLQKNNLQKKERIIGVTLTNITLGLVFVLLWITNLRFVDEGGWFKSFWQPNFAPLPWENNFFDWWSKDFGSAIGYIFGHTQWLTIVLLTMIGIGEAWRINRRLCAFLIPILITIIASLVKIYPIYDRLEIFWLPILTLFFSLGAWSIFNWFAQKNKRGAIALAILSGIIFLWPLRVLVHIQDPQELKQATLTAVKTAKAGDVVYIHYRAAELYRYYFKRYEPKPGVEIVYGTKEELDNLYGALHKRFAKRHLFVLYTEPMYQPNELATFAQISNASGELKGMEDLNYAGFFELQMR
jgi:hypothetical protein